MDKGKRRKLQDAGWTVGAAEEFLGLTEEEAAFVDLKLALSQELKDRRQDQGLSQVALAKRIGSSQSRVAKMEASDPSVSVDLLLRGLLAVGASRQDIGKAVGRVQRGRARRPGARG